MHEPAFNVFSKTKKNIISNLKNIISYLKMLFLQL